MSIIYALVTRKTQVLAEHTTAGLTGNFSTVTRVLLKKIPDEDSKLSYIYDKYIFHYVVSDELTYLCMTDRDFPRNVAFQFLEDIRKRFIETYGDRGKTAIAFAFNADFQRVLEKQMERYNAVRHDKVSKVKEELDGVKGIMMQNIDKVLDRGEKIEDLVVKSEVLTDNASKFKKQSTNLKKAMCWKEVRIKLLVLLVILVVLYIIIAIACGGPDLPC